MSRVPALTGYARLLNMVSWPSGHPGKEEAGLCGHVGAGTSPPPSLPRSARLLPLPWA